MSLSGSGKPAVRMATRAEIRQPGAMESMFGQAGSMSLGGLMAVGSLDAGLHSSDVVITKGPVRQRRRGLAA